MIHASNCKPRLFPVKGDVAPSEIDRAQAIDPTVTHNREKVEEIGRDGSVGYLKKSPTIGYRLTQLEYGNIEFFQKLINSATLGAIGEDEIELKHFKTPYFDICAYLEDDDETFKGTVLYPGLRTTGFSINMGEPQGRIERSFDFVGETAKILKNDNQYYIYNRHECGSGDDNVVDLSVKAPTENPDLAGTYMFRVVRVRGTVSTELARTTDYSYSDGAKELTIVSVQTGDVIKSYYSSTTEPDVQFALNDVDPAGLLGDCVDIYLYIPASGKPSSSDYVYRLQSANIEVRFEREDRYELGNKNIVARGTRDKTVTVTLGRLLEEHTIEEVLRGVSSSYGIIDVSKFSDQITMIVKIYDDNTKTNFKYGIKIPGLSPTELREGVAVNDYMTKDNTLEGESLIITADSSVLGI